jgi:proteasome lid subunit RPN8/RPN11
MAIDNRLTISKAVFDQLTTLARKEAPLEACGLLAGIDKNVTHFYPLTNADAAPEHFSMIPEEQFAAIKDMRTKSINMLGIWHSHPETPARMSEEDLRLAFTPDVIYVITSLTEDIPSISGFRVEAGEPVGIQVFLDDES